MTSSFAKQVFIFSVIAFSCLQGQATDTAQRPPSVLAENSIAYSSMDEAAVAGLKLSASKSMNHEFAGCLYTDGTNFFHTEPASNGQDESFEIECFAPKSLVLAGLFHTHPSGFIDGFSGQDLVFAHQLKLTSYVGLLNADQVIKYIPGSTRNECFTAGMISCDLGHRISRGKLVKNRFMK